MFRQALIIAREPEAQERLQALLRGLECESTAVWGAREAVAALFEARFELLVVSFCADALSAAAQFREVRREPGGQDLPFIAVYDEPGLRLFDLRLAPDEMVVEPFTEEEFAARFRLLGRRLSRSDEEGTIALGPVVLDLPRYAVLTRGRPVELTFKEYELLRLLATNRGVVFDRDRILERVWGPDYLGGSRTVDVHIRRLRAKLPEIAERIRTVHGVGYALDG